MDMISFILLFSISAWAMSVFFCILRDDEAAQLLALVCSIALTAIGILVVLLTGYG